MELSGRRRYAARARAEKMDGVPQPGPWWHAVGAPLERGVRQHWFVVGLEAQKFVALGLKTGLRDGGMLAEVLQPLREVLEGCTVARTAAEKPAF